MSCVLIRDFNSIGWRGRGSDPRTADRLSSTFTEDERLVLYDYAVANTESHPPLPEFDV